MMETVYWNRICRYPVFSIRGENFQRAFMLVSQKKRKDPEVAVLV